ncbi:MAG: rod shape-determining protein [Opitutaceae bacterium]
MSTPEPAKAGEAAASAKPSPSPQTVRKASGKPIVLGFDFGTNKSSIITGAADSDDIQLGKIVPTVVGYVKEGIINGIIPGNAVVLFGEEALKNKLHVRLVNPLGDGVIQEREAAKTFVAHVRQLVDPSGDAEIRAVIGLPANAGHQAREDLRYAVAGSFDRILVIPEPFLAALGVRDDARVGQPNYVDPVNNSLFVDIGAGSTDLCLVQGVFPTAEDQISFPLAGDSIDEKILAAINQQYPESGLSLLKVRSIKEEHAYVGASRKPIDVKVLIGGKARTIELGDVIGNACNDLFHRVLQATKALIARASGDSIEQMLQNIIITGGGSQIKGIDTELQRHLVEEGYENPKVRPAGKDYQRYVAIGALKAARSAREAQWQYVLS